MTTVLGKRKSRASVTPKAAAPAEKPAISEEEAREIFRRHFEAQFAPLDESTTTKTKTKTKTQKKSNGKSRGKVQKSIDAIEDDDVEDMRSSDEEEDDDDGDDDDEDDEDEQGDNWDGLSGSEGQDDDEDDDESEANKIEVVDYTQSNTPKTNPLAAALAKREAKAYLSSKVPLASVGGDDDKANGKTKQKNHNKTPTEEDSADLVKNDLALQRLLSESHLFNPTKRSGSLIGSAVTTEHIGRNRHLATDMRVGALSSGNGAKGGGASSIYKQDKMPMSHRKGIEGARRDREAKRRREAKENGIILEREASSGSGGKKFSAARKRERAVDAPAVGKMRGGMLRLSKRDVAEINGPVRGGGKTKKRRR
jgi:hypothetical protein